MMGMCLLLWNEQGFSFLYFGPLSFELIVTNPYIHIEWLHDITYAAIPSFERIGGMEHEYAHAVVDREAELSDVAIQQWSELIIFAIAVRCECGGNIKADFAWFGKQGNVVGTGASVGVGYFECVVARLA